MRRRLVEATAALLEGTAGKTIKMVALNKSLFYLDLVHLRDHGVLLTGAKYIAADQGPIVASYERNIIKPMQELGLAEQYADGRAKPLRLLVESVEYTELTPDQVSLARQVAEDLADHLAATLSNFSHQNPGWIAAYRPEGKKEFINLHLALQQLCEVPDEIVDDPWLDEEPSDEDFAVDGAVPWED